MGAHLENAQRREQKGLARNDTQVINSDGEQLSRLCLWVADYRKAELPGRVGWWKWRLFAELLPAGGQKDLNQS